ncbi:MAG: O-antigen ligase family protein [Gammaproteobacteria bacterium]|nr:O-antigen ligase family protein [Gammaproteobacteria bacterium]
MNRACFRFNLRPIFIIVLFCFVGVAPYIPYFRIFNAFGYGDLVVTGIFLLAVCKIEIRLTFISFLPLLLFIISIISLFINVSGGYYSGVGLFGVAKWVYFFILTAVISNKYSSIYDLRNVLLGAYVGILLSISLTWVKWSEAPVFLNSVPMLHLQAFSDDFVINRNYVGFFVSIGVSVSTAYFFLSKNIVEKTFNAVILLSFFVTSLLTFSKGAWVTSIASILVLFLLVGKPLEKLMFSFFLIFCVPILLSVDSVVNNEFVQKIDQRITGSESTNAERLNYILDAATVFLNNPLFGIGPGGYREATRHYSLNSTSDPHNALLWVAAEMGVFALIIVTWLFCSLFLYFRRGLSSSSVKLVAFSFLLPVLFNIPFHGLPISMKYIWILLGVYISLLKNGIIYGPIQTGLVVPPSDRMS